MVTNHLAMARRRALLLSKAQARRTNEVARLANDLQKDNKGLTRSEALRVAEKCVPH